MGDNNELDGSSEGDGSPRSRESVDGNSSVKIKFRNYKPQTEFLDGLFIVDRSEPASINEFIKDKLDMITDGNYNIDPNILEPKKVDWDLKRRLERRVEILERETRKGISKHIKDARKKR